MNENRRNNYMSHPIGTPAMGRSNNYWEDRWRATVSCNVERFEQEEEDTYVAGFSLLMPWGSQSITPHGFVFVVL